jgi:hypothetical protein
MLDAQGAAEEDTKRAVAGYGQVPQSLEQIEEWMKAGGKSLANSSSVGEPSQMDVLNEILLDEAEQKTLAAEWKVIIAKADASSVHRKQTARIAYLETKVLDYQNRLKVLLQRYKRMIQKAEVEAERRAIQKAEAEAEAERRAIQKAEAEQTPPKKWKMGADGRWARA